MPRRIDVELTSAKEDGSFTWRAAGAKQPKGIVPGSLLYGGAKVGDVVRAEADFDVEGITIVSVVPPPQAAARPQPARIEIVGAGRDEPGVTSSVTPKGRGGRGDDERGGSRDGERRGSRDAERRGPRPDRGDRPGGPPGAERPRRSGEGGSDQPRRPGEGGPQRTGDRRGPRPDRAERSGAGARPERSGRPDRAPQGDRPGRPPRDQGERSRPKRLSPGSTHRDAYLAGLVPEQQVVAELLLRGGIPAVRAAVAQQNQNRPEGAPAIDAEPLVGLAEQMLPSVREAEWRDRAEAAKAVIDEVGLRDLRAIVTAADASARGDEARELASELRSALERRTTTQREEWLAEMTTCLADGKVVRALRLSSRPPDPTTKVPSELLEQLRTAAGQALGPDTPQDLWAALLEAVVASPVRRTVQPTGLPPSSGPALQLAARQASGRIPALALMLGVDLPPPPGPRPGKGPRPTPPPPRRQPRPEAAPASPVAQPQSAAPATEPAAGGGPAEVTTTPAAVQDQPAEASADAVPATADVAPVAADAVPAAADVAPAGAEAESLPAADEVAPVAVEADAVPAGASPSGGAGAPEDATGGGDEVTVAADGRPEAVDEPEEESSPAGT